MAAGLDRHLQLGADTIGGGDQDRVGEPGGAGIEQGAESAKTGSGAGAGGGAGQRLDGLDQGRAGIDIDAGCAVGQTFGRVMRGNGLPRGIRCDMVWVKRVGRTLLDLGRFAMASLERRLGVFFLVALLIGLGPAVAWAADAFAMRGISVDVTAATAAAARDQALAEAERTGFRRLLERFTVPADHAKLPSADARQYVRDVAIEQERTSTVRYIATLTVRYNPSAVRKLLRESGLRHAEPRPRPVAVVPIYRPVAGGAPVAWGEPSTWRSAWTGLAGGGLVALVIAQPETNDPTRPPVPDAAALAAYAERTRITDIVLATAAPNAAGTAIEVTLAATGAIGLPFDSRSFPMGEGGADAALQTAAQEISQGLDTVYKQQNLLSFDRAADLVVLVPLGGFDDWLAVRDRLGRVPMIRRWDIISLARDEAALSLRVAADPEQVRASLAASGLSLDQVDGLWTLRLAGRK
jgi:hypothetical protein